MRVAVGRQGERERGGPVAVRGDKRDREASEVVEEQGVRRKSCGKEQLRLGGNGCASDCLTTILCTGLQLLPPATLLRPQ